MCGDWSTLLSVVVDKRMIKSIYRFHNVSPRNSKDKYTVPVHIFHHAGIAQHNHLRKEKTRKEKRDTFCNKLKKTALQLQENCVTTSLTRILRE